MRTQTLLRLFVLAAVFALAAVPAGAANVVIINNDGAGEGFNDPSTPDPTWGCPDGMTLGECRLNAFQAAGDRWGELMTSPVEIRVAAQMNPMTCSGLGAVLGSTAPGPPVRDFPNAPFANTWYHSALADSLAGYDLYPAGVEMSITFNSNLDDDPACTLNWWYGTNGEFPGNFYVNPDPYATHFFAVVLHEMGHGLGHADFVNLTNGQLLGGYPDIYTRFMYDVSLGLHWNEMTNPQRVASAVNTGNVVYDGPQDKAAADLFLTGNNIELTVNSGTYTGRGGWFGGGWALIDGLSATIEVVNDGTGASTSDACEPLVGFTPGNIAFIDRGTCAFGLKSVYAEQAGAVAVIIANNQGGTALVNMSGSQWSRLVTIPVMMITENDGNTVRPFLPAAGSFLVLDVNGLHANGYPLIYAPGVLELGSSMSHYDTTAEPSALMEPFVNVDLYDNPDMTLGMYLDEGWVVGLLFGDGFESGDVTAWSAFVP